MDKLIELLNESAVLDTIFENEYQVKFKATKIISKELGFIKRLVDNDKIDRDKCGFKNEGFRNWYDKGIALVENYDNYTYKVTEFYRPYFQLLMLLSIQDEPIEFLISILK